MFYYLPQNCIHFYPESVNDDFDGTVTIINDTIFKDKVGFGKNVLIEMYQ